MSAYFRDNKLRCKDKQAILDALKTMGFKSEHIIVGEKIHLRGYKRDVREQTADIVIKQEAFRERYGTASNDFGFERTPQGYALLISEYDTSANRGFKPTFLKEYLNAAVKRKLNTVAGSQFKLESQVQEGNKTVITLSRKATGMSLGG